MQLPKRYRFVFHDDKERPRTFEATFDTDRDAEEAMNLLAFGMAMQQHAHHIILLEQDFLTLEWRQIKLELLS